MSKASRRRRLRNAPVVFLVVLVFSSIGCKGLLPVDTTPLDNVGMDYDSIQSLKALKITAPEVAEVAEAKQAGMSDKGCVAILQIFRSHGARFNAGDSTAGLLQVGTGEDTILELAKLNQLGL